jgi:hypothetical protein
MLFTRQAARQVLKPLQVDLDLKESRGSPTSRKPRSKSSKTRKNKDHSFHKRPLQGYNLCNGLFFYQKII